MHAQRRRRGPVRDQVHLLEKLANLTAAELRLEAFTVSARLWRERGDPSQLPDGGRLVPWQMLHAARVPSFDRGGELFPAKTGQQ